ncbi:hypothetical protein [Actinoplanes auranticolor]|uniref:hypothetical protein n=1 Tax=Actinoplanes auranticolor TaxID=47988 RepID=UPI001BB3366E|nr:hypothetical protein [Actinoplanes auranticolor]
MRIGRRRLGAALAGVLAVVILALGAMTLVRWRAAGVPRTITPPAGAVPQPPAAERVVIDRAHIMALGLRSDRGDATVHTYSLPARSPWLQARKIVATQLDHWEQLGDCADDPAAPIVECAWREPTRWWPREVRLTMMRLPQTQPDHTYLIIASGRGD